MREVVLIDIVREVSGDQPEIGLFICYCGEEFEGETGKFYDNKIKGCGCKKTNFKHGMCGKPEYYAWKYMKTRCLDQSYKYFNNYGGRGITICERWLDVDSGFVNFFADMGEKPSKEHTLDRKDVNGNYEPNNCVWATKKEQANNRRNTRHVIYQGKEWSMGELAATTNISLSTLASRISAGWDVEEAIKTPCNLKYVTFKGETKRLRDFCKDLGMDYDTVLARINAYNWSVEDALTKPIGDKAQKYTFDGKTLSIPQWSKELGVPISVLRYRIKQNLPVEEVFTSKDRRTTHPGKRKNK